MDKRTLSDMARCNRTAMICHLVEASMIAITFIAQLLVGSRGLLYSLLVVVLAMGPPLMELFSGAGTRKARRSSTWWRRDSL